MVNYPISLKICYPRDERFVDAQTGKVINTLELAEYLGYTVYDKGECRLILSQYHHPECVCNYCTNGREALSGSEY